MQCCDLKMTAQVFGFLVRRRCGCRVVQQQLLYLDRRAQLHCRALACNDYLFRVALSRRDYMRVRRGSGSGVCMLLRLSCLFHVHLGGIDRKNRALVPEQPLDVMSSPYRLRLPSLSVMATSVVMHSSAT